MAIFGFIFGAAIGSFVNVLIDRIPQKRSIWKGRSQCDSCQKKLSYYELIPLFSFLFLRGKCRSCKNKIPNRLFLIELFTAFIFSILFWFYESGVLQTTDLVYILLVITIGIAIFFVDLQYGIIPDSLNVVFLAISLTYTLLFTPSQFGNHILSGICAFVFFFLLFAFTKGKGMGFGDVKYSFVMGFFLGFPNIIVALYLAFLTGAIVSLILVMYGEKSFNKGTIPFGPFLVSSSIISYLFGEKIFQFFLAYLHL